MVSGLPGRSADRHRAAVAGYGRVRRPGKYRSRESCWARQNATVGGTDPQDANVICGNGAQGVLIEPGASGNQVLGNQIGVVGPSNGVLLPGGQRRGRGVDPVAGDCRQSREHRLCVEQHDRRGSRRSRQRHLGKPRRRRSHRGRGRDAKPGRGQLHRRGSRRRVSRSATASRGMGATACGSTTRPITRSAGRSRRMAT